MFKSAYDTTVCKEYQVGKCALEMARYIGVYGVGVAGGRSQLVAVPGADEYNSFVLMPGVVDIPPFAHPLKINDYQNKPTWVVDNRNFMRISQEGTPVPVDRLACRFNEVRLGLQCVWDVEEPLYINNLGNFQLMLFARWVSEAITRRCGLPPETQMRVSVLCAFHYLCMFRDFTETMEYGEELKMSAQISRATFVPAAEVMSILSDIRPTISINDFVTLLKEQSQSVRLSTMNLALLYTIIGGGWFGTNSRELLAVALEHPPTWVTIITMARAERGYRKTVIGEMVTRYDKGDDAKSFHHAAIQLITPRNR